MRKLYTQSKVHIIVCSTSFCDVAINNDQLAFRIGQYITYNEDGQTKEYLNLTDTQYFFEDHNRFYCTKSSNPNETEII